VELLDNEELMLAHGLERPHILQHRHPHAGYVLKSRSAAGNADGAPESRPGTFRRIG